MRSELSRGGIDELWYEFGAFEALFWTEQLSEDGNQPPARVYKYLQRYWRPVKWKLSD